MAKQIPDWKTMKVVLNGKMSREIPVDSGVPQGADLSPLLFLCHINDLLPLSNLKSASLQTIAYYTGKYRHSTTIFCYRRT